ncbi:hypothetical protein [Pseudoxanthomonas composti]|uniref:Uncharacterized protein n=1 Tax=Pseudoxanthomonas composti TaxID=2137479 RepID=A0A4Q1JR51_9GAMM|nr:hypothetical protein [Pseudoxanthomonas composti]RXQ99902.1 hypothetical protein EPA99_17410 [Pseudoxanthomonas composti]
MKETRSKDDLPLNPSGDVSDQDKAFTPDQQRADKAWHKHRDMPDTDPDKNKATPADYEKPAPGSPEK